MLYKQYFDKDIQFVRPIMADGSWRTPYDPANSIHMTGDFTEGNGWQYTFFAPHDVYGLINLFGGDKPFIAKLDAFFVNNDSMGEQASADITGLIGQYAHGNEPSHHIAHLYNYVGQPWRTQELVDEVLHTLYSNAPDGLSGNEDCGQMSAWYLLNAMGFYQVCPGRPVYSIGRPLFNQAIIHLPGDKTFTIVARNNSRTNRYVKEIRLNGNPLNEPFFTHQQLMQGGLLELTMIDEK